MNNEFYEEVENHLRNTLLPEEATLKSIYNVIISDGFKIFLKKYTEEYSKDLCDKLLDITPLTKDSEDEILKKLNGIKYFKIFIDEVINEVNVNKANIKIAQKTLDEINDPRSM